MKAEAMTAKAKTWFVVADAAHGRVFAQDGAGGAILPVPGLTFVHPVEKDSDLFTDGPSRSFDGGGRHSAERHDRAGEHQRKFIETVAAPIEKGAASGAFTRLVLVCAPHTLGELRAALGPHSAKLVVREVDKDLVKLGDSALAERLGALMAG